MPLYDYRCEPCGDFEAWQRLAELDNPMLCPTCQGVSQRLFSPPTNINLNAGSFPVGRASAKEPRVAKRKTWETPKPKNQVANTSRPWMIGHAPKRL